jgi:redox-sensitive bicupin YhaK (pirin superfamily)
MAIGAVAIGNKQVNAGQFAVFDTSNALLELIASHNDTRLIHLNAWPFGETVVQYSPCVMTTIAEVEQAIQDFNQGKF